MESFNGFEMEQRGGFKIIRPSERLGMQESEWLAETLNPLINEGRIPLIVVDLEHVMFLSSRSLGVLMAARTAANRRDGRLILSNVRPDVARVLHITRVDTVFEVVSDIEEMLKLSEETSEDTPEAAGANAA